MCLRNTARQVAVVLTALALAGVAAAQSVSPDWRRLGNSALDLSLASVATGPIERVWYADDGSRVFARASAERTYVTDDFETWTAVPSGESTPIPPQSALASRSPEAGARIRGERESRTRVYAIGRYVYRSDDAGTSWTNVTSFKGASILGDGMLDLAMSPRDPDEVVVATDNGVWRSVDGGQSWSGLNQTLPNLLVRRLLSTPQGANGTRAAIDVDGKLTPFEWQPGEKQAWRAVQDPDFERDQKLSEALSASLQTRITAVAVAGEYMYAGSADGRLWSSSDRGSTFTPGPDQYSAPIQAIFADPRAPQLALAALGARFADATASASAPHVLRTINGGGFWDDLTSNLPDIEASGIAADRGSGAVYVATGRGVFLAFEDLSAAGAAAAWTPVPSAVPNARTTDVRLDPFGHQLYVAIEGYGVYAAPAPHRFRSPRIVSAADLADRPAAPGALVTVFGANVRSARAGSLDSPVLAASDAKSEIQIPFEATGTSLSLALDATSGPLTLGIPLQHTAPAIFVDAEGAPMVLDADAGVLLDTMRPARSNSRIQILATGLGQVSPPWRSGLPAPMENPPAVQAPVRAFLDRVPVQVTRATLAPGYVGFYLIEVQLPKLVNYGPAELYIEADGQPSNRVRVYIEP